MSVNRHGYLLPVSPFPQTPALIRGIKPSVRKAAVAEREAGHVEMLPNQGSGTQVVWPFTPLIPCASLSSYLSIF